jgi:Secretion system C-terminal sorting domain
MKSAGITILCVVAILCNNKICAQTIISVAKVNTPGLPNSGLILNGGFETGAPPNNTWYQWAKTGCNPTPATRYPTSWTVTASASNASGGSPVRYATWGKLVVGTGSSGTYPNIPTTQRGLYEVYSTSSTACTNTNTTAAASDPGTFPLAAASVDGGNYLYFGNGTGSISGFPKPLAAWISSTSSPNNLRVYADNSSLGTLSGPAPITLAQTVTTVSGINYALEFWVAGEEFSPGTQKDGFFQLDIGTQKLYLAIPGSANDHGLGSQMYYQIRFTAASTSTTIKFTNYCHPVAAQWASYLQGAIGSELLLDDVRMNLVTVLPVRLISLSGSRIDNKIDLTWQVALEENFSHYEVERSFSLADPFVRLGSVSPTKNDTKIYHYTDDLRSNEAHEFCYYRLKMVDISGKFSYSNSIRLAVKNASGLSILGNPVADALTIQGLRSKGTISVFDMLGKKIFDRQVQSQTMSITVGYLKPGIYILHYTDGQQSESAKFVKS